MEAKRENCDKNLSFVWNNGDSLRFPGAPCTDWNSHIVWETSQEVVYVKAPS